MPFVVRIIQTASTFGNDIYTKKNYGTTLNEQYRKAYV